MKNAKLLIALLLLVGFAGCKDEPAGQVQTVDWYKAHQAERMAVLAKCKDNPGQMAATLNCINATRAESANTWGSRGSGVKVPVAPTAYETTKNP